MTSKRPDPLSDLGAICRDDRCGRADVHLVHEITAKRGRPPKPKKEHTAVVVSPPSPPRAKVRGWHKCHTCAGRGTCAWEGKTQRCPHCDGKGAIFVGGTKPTGKGPKGKKLVYNGKAKTVIEWSYELGIPKITIYKRLRAGMPLEQVLAKGRLK